MSRITREIAKDVARKLCRKSLKKQTDATEQLVKYVSLDRYSKIPQEIVVLVQQKNPWVALQENSLRMGPDFDHRWLSISSEYPQPEDSRESNNYTFSTPESRIKAIELWKKEQKYKKEYEKLILEVEEALLALRTFKRAVVSIPECATLLPQTEAMFLPAIDFDVLRSRLG